jgi:hypothetical protein
LTVRSNANYFNKQGKITAKSKFPFFLAGSIFNFLVSVFSVWLY